MFNTVANKIDDVLLTLWVGGLWVIGYVVAPILFGSLDDRRLAGELAGNMFTAINCIGLIGGVYLLFNTIRSGLGAWYKNGRVLVLILMLLIVLISMFVIQPMMQELKAVGLPPGSDAAAQFGKLHGLSSVLYLVMSLAGLFLIVKGKQGA